MRCIGGRRETLAMLVLLARGARGCRPWQQVATRWTGGGKEPRWVEVGCPSAATCLVSRHVDYRDTVSSSLPTKTPTSTSFASSPSRSSSPFRATHRHPPPELRQYGRRPAFRERASAYSFLCCMSRMVPRRCCRVEAHRLRSAPSARTCKATQGDAAQSARRQVAPTHLCRRV